MAIEVFRTVEFELRVTPVGDSFRVEAPGLARALGYRDAYRLVESIPDGEKGYTTACTPGGDQRIWYVTEAGFYQAIGQRQAARVKDIGIRAMVERFQAWVFGEVLPSIRRGARPEATAVVADVSQLGRRELAQMVIAAEDARELAEKKVAELAPRARSWDVLASGRGDFGVGDAAKILSRDPAIQLGRDKLFAKLREIGWTFRGERGRWKAYQDQVNAGRLSEVIHPYTNERTGETGFSVQVRITPKGMYELHRRLGGRAPLQLPMEAIPS